MTIHSNFNDRYKIKKDAKQISYEKQLGLKANKEYENMTDEAIIKILNYFSELYPGVVIKMPKGREKSPKSILSKIKNLQIERLSKLYAIEGINAEEKQELYELLEERIYENDKLNQNKVLENIQQLLNEPIEKSSVKEILENITEEGVSKSTKTALLRILVSKIEKSSLNNKEFLLNYLDFKYGEKAAKISKIPEDDIIRYSSIEDIKKTQRRMNILHDEQYFLRSKDLRGAEIVITDFPDNLETDNNNLNEMLNKFKNATTDEEKMIYNNKCSVELGKDFIKKIAKNKELLNECGMRIMPYSVKYKNKTNGYEANHIKFEFLKNLDYSFELQIKSSYIEELSKGTGSASHENRPGKERIFPDITNKEKFMKEINFSLPKFTKYIKTEDGYKKYKCSTEENMMEYYTNSINPHSKEYDEIMNIINDEKNKEVL
jgi:hypothetical protein